MAKSAVARERNRLWMKAYRATPEGKAACREAKLRVYQTPEGREVMREGKRRWKKSERGKETTNKNQRKRYVASPRVLLTEEERKRRKKESIARSLAKPSVLAKRKETAWKAHLKRTYGISVEQYEEMSKYGCQICGKYNSHGRKLHVDHDHKTKHVRGVLCDPCNRGLGTFFDDPILLEAAASYLRSTCHR